MKTIFEFLYYCLYRMMVLVKKERENEELASYCYFILLSTHSLMLFFPLRYVFPKGYFTPTINNIILKSTMAIVFVIWYFICKIYFLKKKNYIRIIQNYEQKFPDKKIKAAIAGIVYSLFTFLSFYVTAVYIANGTF